MIHLDDGVLRAWLDRELDPGAGADVRTHVDGCAACSARVRELRRAERVVQAALAVLDRPAPGEAAWARVAAGLAAPAGPRAEPAGRRVWTAGWARAAGFVLLLGGGVAAAVIPGSPLRSLWVRDAPLPAAPAMSATSAEAAPQAGVRATGSEAVVRIDLRAPVGTPVEVVLTGARAGVFGPAAASFSTGEGWLRAEVDGGPVRVELPAVDATARIEVNGVARVVFEEGRLTDAPDDAVRDDGDLRLRFVVR